MPPKWDKLRTGTLLRTVTSEILARLQSRNHDTQGTCPECLPLYYFFHNIHNFFTFFAALKSGWLATKSTPPKFDSAKRVKGVSSSHCLYSVLGSLR